MKRYLLYYRIGTIRFYQRLFFSTIEEAEKFVHSVPHQGYKIFDISRGDFEVFCDTPEPVESK